MYVRAARTTTLQLLACDVLGRVLHEAALETTVAGRYYRWNPVQPDGTRITGTVFLLLSSATETIVRKVHLR
jgi:hypothetical protein